MKIWNKDALFRTSVLAGLMASGAAFAPAQAQEPVQTAQPEPAAQQPTESIRVTGTRIQSPGVVANSPITSIGEEEFDFRQPVAVEELIRTLPAAIPAIGPGTNNGSGGGATVNLRGLGSNRNLVLMDGRRIVPFNVSGVTDTNVIPLALIERVDLVTGGAAAVYGSDAISGVVNFVLRNDFEGVEISGQYGSSEEGDATRRRIDATIGGNTADGRGNAVLSVGYTKTDQLRQGDRPFGEFSLDSVSGARGGSGTTVPSAFNTPATGPNGPLGTRFINPTTGLLEESGSAFNFNPDNLYQGPIDRYQVLALANYEINRHFDVYLNSLYVTNDVGIQLAASGTFNNIFNTPIGNPFIPEPARQQLCANRDIAAADCVSGPGGTTLVPLAINRRITELGPRLNTFANDTFQYTIGTRGDLFAGFTYDVYYQRGQSQQVSTRENWGSLSAVRTAMNTVSATECLPVSPQQGDTDLLLPGTVGSPVAGCVPLNPFGAEGSITQDMVDFINLNGSTTTNVEEEIIFANVSGDLGFSSPWAMNTVAVSGGYEYRRLVAGTQADAATQTPNEILGTGAPTPDREGTFQVYEFFGEAYIPLIEDRAFARSLALEVGARNTSFRTGGESDNYWTYKVGGEWAPIDDLRFRSMFQRATRAPSVNELFAPQVTGLGNLAVDPCAGPGVSGALAALCVQTGVPQGAIGVLPQPSAGQVNVLTGGNPELGPEVGESITVGFVFSPSFFPGFTASLDYWDIELTDAISSRTVNEIINGCYTTAANPNLEFNELCALVGRSPTSGNLNDGDADGIAQPLSNVGFENRQGWDLLLNYRFDLADLGASPDLGSITLGFNGTLFTKYTSQATPGSPVNDCLGHYSTSCANPISDIRATTRATWNVANYDLSLMWRHYSSVTVQPGAGNFLDDFSSIPAYNYFDLSGGWDFNDNVRLVGTVQNLTNEQPPVVGNSIGATATNSGNTFPQTYDTIGRFYSLSARVRF
ncbi:TonB-dependent receptor [Glycocaulis profundi]|nr:TonB-dependent receptor [Glycocaulis profundi]